jgi:O-antigen ligase
VDPDQGSRAALTFGNENGAAAYFALSLVVVLIFGIPRRRTLRLGAVTLIGVALLLTGSLAGVASLALVAIAAPTLAVWRRWGVVPAIALSLAGMLCAAAALWLVNTPRLVDAASASGIAIVRDSLGRGRASSGSRALLAREIEDLIKTGPPIGRGPASTAASLRARQAGYPKEAHNDFAAALAERGIGGAVGVILIFIAVTWRAVEVAVRSRRPRTALGHPYLFLAAVPVLLVFAFTHEILHDRAVWMFFGLLAAAHLSVVAGSIESEETTR